ncbi:hypothetical protein Scep_002668 [Stephania cephalantha]|uniref:DNA-(apurinic or apyrimidinic site) lyase n=1 Tax=Stephania cephalantha TaxID=152367 RepID=A0AAP0LBZ7_9MAGN
MKKRPRPKTPSTPPTLKPSKPSNPSSSKPTTTTTSYPSTTPRDLSPQTTLPTTGCLSILANQSSSCPSLSQQAKPSDGNKQPLFNSQVLYALVDFLNLGISLVEIWEAFSASDSRFAELAPHLVGLLKWWILFRLGARLGTVEGLDFYEFPSLDRLALVSEEEFRAAGFGYRHAFVGLKYIVGTVEALQSKPGGGAKWLASLRDLDLCDVIEALSTLPGVGPKVAACIALFSLDQHHAVPVDTHVWQIATRYLTPELAGVQLTPKLCNRVAEAFVTKYGKYAGWAQTVLFIAELPSQKGLLPSPSVTTKKTKTIRRKNKANSARSSSNGKTWPSFLSTLVASSRFLEMLERNHRALILTFELIPGKPLVPRKLNIERETVIPLEEAWY